MFICMERLCIYGFDFLHSRIILFRPMLIKYCQTQPVPKSTSESSLGDNFARDCAFMCVGIAQTMISQMDKCSQIDISSVGLMHWWYRIFHLHLASTVLVIGHLRTELSLPHGFHVLGTRPWQDCSRHRQGPRVEFAKK
ncbi:hypothetical protein BB8028_0003g02900 [Beauveria bassiana]|uniref:Uncharacterized protein n=1 Tax=Beauveria bassiana TaxID=176275 RepID=A0A2S7Y671_BEABA|nr:hypothetical protein BB8028_0003g02900 [Beauveria bassiana]